MVRACQAGARQKGCGGVEAQAVLSEAAILSALRASSQQDAIACLKRAIEITGRLDMLCPNTSLK